MVVLSERSLIVKTVVCCEYCCCCSVVDDVVGMMFSFDVHVPETRSE